MTHEGRNRYVLLLIDTVIHSIWIDIIAATAYIYIVISVEDRRVFLCSVGDSLSWYRSFILVIMNGRKICNGYGTVVVKPIICSTCNMASHLSCLPRIGHSNGQLTNCNGLVSPSRCTNADPALINTIKEMLHKEFANFQKEIRDLYRADMERVKDNIKSLSERIDQLENLLASSQPSASPFLLEENIFEELENRQRRSIQISYFLIG